MYAAVVVAFGSSVLLTPLAARISRAVGLVDAPSEDELKIHADPVPLGGGIAVAVATMVAVAVTEPGLEMAAAVGAAMLVALGVGVADDAVRLPPWVRVLAQASCGVLLVLGGFRISPLGGLGAVAVVVIVLAITNAVNLVDGQDGLAGGLGAFAAVGIAIAGSSLGGGWPTVLGGASAGALAGFVVWNRPPARVFLGDGGAYLVGVTLSVLAAAMAQMHGWRGLLVAATSMLVFADELVFTVLRRIRSRSQLASGDRGHSYDLVAARFGRARTLLLFWTAGAVCAAAAILVGRVALWAGVSILASLVLLLGGLTWYLAATGTKADGPRPDLTLRNGSGSTSPEGVERKKGTAGG